MDGDDVEDIDVDDFYDIFLQEVDVVVNYNNRMAAEAAPLANSWRFASFCSCVQQGDLVVDVRKGVIVAKVFDV